MNHLQDSGARTTFATGAIREEVSGRGRCDLMPLAQIGHFLNQVAEPFGDALILLDEYIQKGDTTYIYEAIGSVANLLYDGEYFDLLLDLSKQFEMGIEKYEDRNWEKGIPCHRYIDSAVRHYLKELRGDDDENHLWAFFWNLFCLIWTHENKPELRDLPFVKTINKESDLTKDSTPLEKYPYLIYPLYPAYPFYPTYPVYPVYPSYPTYPWTTPYTNTPPPFGQTISITGEQLQNPRITTSTIIHPPTCTTTVTPDNGTDLIVKAHEFNYCKDCIYCHTVYLTSYPPQTQYHCSGKKMEPKVDPYSTCDDWKGI